MKRFILLIIAVFLTFSPVFAYAATVRGVGVYTLGENQTISGNEYIAARDITIKGNIKGDFLAVGGNVIADGTADNDVFLLGGNITASSTVHGDLRVIGGSVHVGGTIDGDLIAAGGTVELLPQAQVKGDIVVLGGQVIVDSTVVHTIKVIAGEAVVNGHIIGNAEITAPTVVVGSTAEITGTTTYFSHSPARVENGAKIKGAFNYNELEWFSNSASLKNMVVSFINFWLLLQFINTLLLAFILLFVFKRFSQEVSDNGLLNFGKHILIGIAVLIGVPVLSVIFITSLFALPIGVLLMLWFAIVYIISSVFAGLMMGILIKKYLFRKNDDQVNFLVAVLGTSVLSILHFVPVVGDPIRLVFFLAAFGTIWRQTYKQVKT